MKVHAGAIDEHAHQAGVAHMVEHLVFRATEQYPNGIMPYLHENQWIRAKHYNAVTNHESTTYMLSPPSHFGLEKSLNVLQQMLFHAHINEQDLDKERQIILEEWRGNQGVASRMNVQRTQSVRIHSRYERHQPIGNEHNIKHLSAKELQQFYQTWYAPNNMHLMIIGDVAVADVQKIIEQQFAHLPAKQLPHRDYYEPLLKPQIRFHQLHDEQSGVSQIAYILRFDEKLHREYHETARKQRLIDRIALDWITQRLKNQQEHYSSSLIKNISIRKADIGKTSVALGFFASVDKTAHRDGLAQILTEIERLKQFPITTDELNSSKQSIQTQLDKAKKHTEDRDFESWVQVMNNTLFSDKPYLTQRELAQRSQPLLDEITVDDVQHQVEQWFKSGDQIVQYQAPYQHYINNFTLDEFEQLQQHIAQKNIAKPQTVKVVSHVELPKQSARHGKIIKQYYQPKLKIFEWKLSNGDSVVWLKTPIAQDKTYWQAISQAGFQRQDLNRWQAQIASQIMEQNPPLAWTNQQWLAWKKQYQISFDMDYQAEQLKFIGHTPTKNIDQLFNFYYTLQNSKLENYDLNDIKQQLEHSFHQQNANIKQQQQQIAQLRFGHDGDDILPSLQEIQQLNADNLQQQWIKIQRTPTVHYIVNNTDELIMKTLIQQYFAPIERQQTSAKMIKFSPKAEREILYLASHNEPKHEIQMWINSPYTWQGQDAMMVSALKSIASQKLKNVLRDEQLGIYRLSFESTLNPQSHQIESELKFSTSPEKSQQMIEQAERVLSNLANLMTEQDIQHIKATLQKQEQERLNIPETWLNRLILSYQRYADGRYIEQMPNITEHITLDKMQALAEKIYHQQGVKILVKIPMEQPSQ